jgi:hypothetical protein
MWSRRAKRLPLNWQAVIRGDARDVALARGAKRLFGSWDKALVAAGFDAPAIRKEARQRFRYPTAESVTAALRERHASGKRLLRSTVEKGPEADPALASGVLRFFGNWTRGVRAAGFDPAKTLAKRSHRKRTR